MSKKLAMLAVAVVVAAFLCTGVLAPIASAHTATSHHVTVVHTQNDTCTPYVYGQVEYWGWWIYLNDCTIQELHQATNVPAAIAALIALYAPPLDPVIGAIAAALLLNLDALQVASQQCGGQGALIEGPLYVVPYVQSVC